MAEKRYSNRELTDALRATGAEIYDTRIVGEDGEIRSITRYEALAELLWKKALGWIEEVDEKGDKGVMVRTKREHKPESWAAQLIYERWEGKTPVAMPEVGRGLTAADRVRDLSKARINRLAKEASGQQAGPPKYVPKKRKRKKNGDSQG